VKNILCFLEIHGGPSAMWGPERLVCGTNTNIFVVKAMGYSNPRGSEATDWILRGNINDWGKDLQAMF
jgi:hypothetical protein